ncbi:protein kinase [Thermodesulfobacteriota bacterium]
MARDNVINKRFRIEKELKSSPSSQTFLAFDQAKEQHCIVKCLVMTRTDSWETVELFEQQAKILSHLDHPNIPEFIDYFTEETKRENYFYLVQEFIQGQSLAQLVEDGKYFTEDQVIELIQKFLDILKYLHGFSPPLIHRNIKPANIFIGDDGEIYLTDFAAIKGKLVDDVEVPESIIQESYAYTPLEVLKGEADPSSDIYSIGASMIFALSHTSPDQMGSMGSALDFRKHVNISKDFYRILSKMVRPEQKDRYQNVQELISDLNKLTRDRQYLPETGPKISPLKPLLEEFLIPLRVLIRKRKAVLGILAAIILGVAGFKVFFPAEKPSFVSVPVKPKDKGVIRTSAAAEVWTGKKVYKPNEPIIVNYSGLPGNTQDWLTVVKSSAADNTYKEWFYTNGKRSGSYQFKGLPAGHYEVRVYYRWPSGGYRVQGRSAFTVAQSTDQTGRYYPLKVNLVFDGRPIRKITTVTPSFSVYHRGSRKTYSPVVTAEGILYVLTRVPEGKISLSVEIDAESSNPNRYPGDYLIWGAEVDVTAAGQMIDVDLYRVIRLTEPQDSHIQMKFSGSSDCVFPASFQGPVTFSWVSLGDGVVYQYLLGTVDCVEHVYHEGSVAKGQTSDTHVSFDLPNSKTNEKYAFHLMARKNGNLIGRLYVHDEGGSNWNYGFRVKPKSSGTVVEGKIFFDGKPITEISAEKPYFWFRNEKKGTRENPYVEYQNGKFRILDLPVGRMGMGVDFDQNAENSRSYPGDLRTFTVFDVQDKENPELIVDLQKVIHLTSPQDNNRIMEGWGAPCMEKISFSAPIRFEWMSLGKGVEYRVYFTRMDCLNNYNSNGTMLDKRFKESYFVADLPPSRENECYGFHLYASRNGRKIGILMTHGARGLGWDYRFRIVE